MKVEGLYVYQIAPMDFGWDRLIHVDQYVASLAISDKEERLINEEVLFGTGILSFYAFLHRALRAGRKVGWDGNFRDEPHVGFLPASNEPIIFLVWKHDNNGDTFVACTMELPYLEKHQ